MSTNNSQFDINIIDRAKKVFNCSTDKDLADFLDVRTTVIANWKSRNSINLDVILEKAYGYDVNYILYGISKSEYKVSESDTEYGTSAPSFRMANKDQVEIKPNEIPINKSLFISSRDELMKIQKSDLKIQLSSNILDTVNKELFAYLYHLERPDLHYKRNDILIIDAKNTAVTQDSGVYLCANDRLPDFKTLVLESRKKIIEFEPFEMKDIEHDLTKFSPYIIGKVVGSLSIQHQLTYNANGDLVSKITP